MDRCATIAHRLSVHCRELGMAPVLLTAAQWEHLPDAPNKPFGWLPPKPNSNGLWGFQFCAEILDKQTKMLDDFKFRAFFDAIEIMVDMHVTHKDMPPDDRTKLVESTLYNMAPGSMKLVSQVQMAALDALQETP